jgi:hypothetical protein
MHCFSRRERAAALSPSVPGHLIPRSRARRIRLGASRRALTPALALAGPRGARAQRPLLADRLSPFLSTHIHTHNSLSSSVLLPTSCFLAPNARVLLQAVSLAWRRSAHTPLLPAQLQAEGGTSEAQGCVLPGALVTPPRRLPFVGGGRFVSALSGVVPGLRRSHAPAWRAGNQPVCSPPRRAGRWLADAGASPGGWLLAWHRADGVPLYRKLSGMKPENSTHAHGSSRDRRSPHALSHCFVPHRTAHTITLAATLVPSQPRDGMSSLGAHAPHTFSLGQSGQIRSHCPLRCRRCRGEQHAEGCGIVVDCTGSLTSTRRRPVESCAKILSAAPSRLGSFCRRRIHV